VNIKLRLIPLACALALSACAGVPLGTPSGKPEVFIKGRTQQEVVDRLAASCAQAGATVESQTSSIVTCAREPELMTEALFTTRGGSALMKYQNTVFKVPGGVRVITTSCWIESVNGFGGTSRTMMNISGGNTAQAIQGDLERFKGMMENGQ
jgi:hypothetical protein